MMEETMTSTGNAFFGTEKVWKLLLRLAPPIMLAQLIQALYNIVDSYFVGQYSQEGLAALSVIFPIQLLISALAIGTGVGVNTVMTRYDGIGEHHHSKQTAGTGFVLSVISWVVFAGVMCFIMPFFTASSLSSITARQDANTYGLIVCGFSFGIFLESNFTKVIQARGNVILPMIAQVIGALTNIVLDWLLIFGIGIFPQMGVAGAALATVIGQIAAAVITSFKGFAAPPAIRKIPACASQIYKAGIPNILMNALCTNVI